MFYNVNTRPKRKTTCCLDACNLEALWQEDLKLDDLITSGVKKSFRRVTDDSVVASRTGKYGEITPG